MRRQSGVTLVELLAVLAISSIILITAYSIYTTAMRVNKASIEDVNIRNETIEICNQFDKMMLNVDTIEIIGEANSEDHFTSFWAIENGVEMNTTSGEYEEIERSKVAIEINKKDLLIKGRRINSDPYSVEGSSFSLKNGGLLVNLIISDQQNNQKFEVNKFYRL